MKFNTLFITQLLLFIIIISAIIGFDNIYANDQCDERRNLCIDLCLYEENIEECNNACEIEYISCKQNVIYCWKNAFIPCYDKCIVERDHYFCEDQCNEERNNCIDLLIDNEEE